MTSLREPLIQVTDPGAAVTKLRAALTRVGIVLPSLGVDDASPGLALIELGRVRADVAERLAEAIGRGAPDE
ncbi:hypothetical protein [Streptomyces sp. NPDC059743]|uniref:hypothetical protein n=1 Tax=Streptomyces sp. NPDC059743 TaxID=3346928 RepID=UPI00364C1718